MSQYTLGRVATSGDDQLVESLSMSKHAHGVVVNSSDFHVSYDLWSSRSVTISQESLATSEGCRFASTPHAKNTGAPRSTHRSHDRPMIQRHHRTRRAGNIKHRSDSRATVQRREGDRKATQAWNLIETRRGVLGKKCLSMRNFLLGLVFALEKCGVIVPTST